MDAKLERLLIRFIMQNKENVYRLAFSYVKNEKNALNIVQESIHKALASLITLNPEGSMKGWFYRIVVNTSLDFLRKQNPPFAQQTLDDIDEEGGRYA
ncbi:hypothetical protein KQI79_21290 [Paenibacillus sp. MSJ-34]|nr:sigma factor [Paenibacillus sp. MSJ-34]MBU5444562.1 hypothetical protein [Paenibacillus sp. MSJ-34]